MAQEQLRISNEILERVNETMVCAPADVAPGGAQLRNEPTDALSGLTQVYDSALRPSDCAEVLELGGTESGVYTIYPTYGEDPFFVFCDMETDGGGWTVSEMFMKQRRFVSSLGLSTPLILFPIKRRGLI